MAGTGSNLPLVVDLQNNLASSQKQDDSLSLHNLVPEGMDRNQLLLVNNGEALAVADDGHVVLLVDDEALLDDEDLLDEAAGVQDLGQADDSVPLDP